MLEVPREAPQEPLKGPWPQIWKQWVWWWLSCLSCTDETETETKHSPIVLTVGGIRERGSIGDDAKATDLREQYVNIGGSRLQCTWRPLGEQSCWTGLPQQCAGDMIKEVDQGPVRLWLVLAVPNMRSTPKTRLAAVTRTVELTTGTMCVSQWLTCF